MVAKVNPDCKSVTVEWNEKGETKGKEIELTAIRSLNADIFNGGAPEPEPKNNQAMIAASNLTRVSSYRAAHGSHYVLTLLRLFRAFLDCKRIRVDVIVWKRKVKW